GDETLVLCVASDQKLCSYVKANNINHCIVNCQENNLLQRYLQCAEQKKASHIIRITADCPLIDSTWIERVSDALDKFDYASNTMHRTVIDGDDVQGISKTALDWYAKKIPEEEHLFSHIECDMLFRDAFIQNGFTIEALVHEKTMIENPFHPLTKRSIDTKEDLERVRRYYEDTTKS
ncbi:MAG: hypothetical protein KDK51_09605, partial [Deltaproteobacteria bacterium]|nr:hypothetical protein [Deltaproteobacteria bacterium]